jgi:hypothetical protein
LNLRLGSAVGAALLAFAFGAAAAPAATVTVPGGTTVPVRMTATLSSSTAKAGESFLIAASAPTRVGGAIVIARGATGKGEVVSVSPAGKSGRQGTLSIKFDWISAVDGSRIRLAGINRNAAGQNKKGTANTANIASTIVLGPVGLFAHNFVKGKEIVIDPSTTFNASTGRTVTVVAKSAM